MPGRSAFRLAARAMKCFFDIEIVSLCELSRGEALPSGKTLLHHHYRQSSVDSNVC